MVIERNRRAIIHPARWYHKMVPALHPTMKGKVEHSVMDGAIMDELNRMSTSGIKLK
jgi:hypothetical protein